MENAIVFAGLAIAVAFLWGCGTIAHALAKGLDKVATAIRTQPAVQIDYIAHDKPPREPWQGDE